MLHSPFPVLVKCLFARTGKLMLLSELREDQDHRREAARAAGHLRAVRLCPSAQVRGVEVVDERLAAFDPSHQMVHRHARI